jgi:cobalt-zinc-cadmium resistance protein CzcA
VSAWVLTHAAAQPSRAFRRVQAAYARLLERVLARRAPVVAAAAAVVVASVVSLEWIGTEFMPRLDEGAILINTRRLPSVSLADATRLSREAERIVRRFPEVRTVVTKEGRPDLATEAMGLFEGDMYVILKERDAWTTARDREGLVAAFDSALRVVPGLWVSFTQPLAMRLDEAESGIRTDLGIKVVGPDLDRNQAVAERVLRVVRSVPGSADAAVEVSEGTGEIQLRVRRDALARHGLSVADVQGAIELAMGQRTAGEWVDGFRRVPIAVRLPDALRDDPEALARLVLRAPDGARVPLGEVVDVVSGTGPELIAHEDAQRRALVLSNVRGRDLGRFVEEVRARVAREVRLPPGMFLEWGGQYENQQRAMGRLRLVVPAALLLIAALLFAAFRSVPQALLVLLNVPFALVGGIAALWLRALNLSLSASIGFIALFGIAVLNGVVLVMHLNALRAAHDAALGDAHGDTHGREREPARLLALSAVAREGARDRLRPVLMTALVASLGFVPMALSSSAGAEVQRPLATVVIGGLLTSTALTLLVLPALWLSLAEWGVRRAARRAARAPVAAAEPPAHPRPAA